MYNDVSEFCMSKPSDSVRYDQILGTMAKDGHPMGKFMWGMCYITLCFYEHGQKTIVDFKLYLAEAFQVQV